MASVAIAWKYTTDPLVLSMLGWFNVFPVDAFKQRLAEALIVMPDSIPIPSEPLLVEMPLEATQVEVVPVDMHGYEGYTTYLPVQTGLPPVQNLSQITIIMVVGGSQ